MADEVTITPLRNGSLHIEGSIRLVLPDGTTLAVQDETWLCRCGASANKPYCDGSHSRIGFRDVPGGRAATDGAPPA